MKTCSACKISKPLSNFYKNRGNTDGYNYQCKLCLGKCRKRHRVSNRDRLLAYNKAYYNRRKQTADWLQILRDQTLKSRYGITSLQYEILAAAQDYTCPICLVKGKELVIDHDHSTNEIRGLICREHNLGLGYFSDSPEILRNAANYIEISTWGKRP